MDVVFDRGDSLRVELKNIDTTTRLVLSLIVGIVSYFFLILVLKSFFLPQPRTMHEMMGYMMGSSFNSQVINIASLLFSLLTGFTAYSWLKGKGIEKTEKKREIDIIKRALSKDEKRVIKEIEKAGTITQDSLRYRLGWSKAKVSSVLSHLDRMRVIQRERTGKTYKVFLEKKLH